MLEIKHMKPKKMGVTYETGELCLWPDRTGEKSALGPKQAVGRWARGTRKTGSSSGRGPPGSV